MLLPCLLATLAAGVALISWPTPANLALLVEPPRNDTGLPSLDRLASSLQPVLEHGAERLPRVRLIDGSGHGTPDVVVHSRLILWNGSAELALRATDERAHTLIWSAFAAGPPASLARHVEDQVGGLDSHLPVR